jgi:hypothetical protein
MVSSLSASADLSGATGQDAQQTPGRGSARHPRWADVVRPVRVNPAVLVVACYLAGAMVVTWRLWADPASRVAAGNVPDADAFAWFLRYDATALLHGRLPSLVTSALNAPQGVNVMWNNFMLLPGVLLAPVTLAFGPQVTLTLLTTAGFAGSAGALFYVLRRWGVGTGAAGLAGAVYGFSPALLHSAIGHYNLEFAVLPPLIADRVLRLALPRGAARLRDGVWLGVLCAAQLFISEEMLAETSLAVVLLLAVLAATAPRVARHRATGFLRGLAAAGCAVVVLAGYPLWVQIFGPLTVHGSRFPADTYQNAMTVFVTPSRYLLFHTAGSAAAAARFPYGAPEYLGYLGWPLLVALVLLTVLCRRHVGVAACAIVFVLLEILSLGSQGRIAGTSTVINLPWSWLTRLPLLGLGLPDRLSIFADGFAAAMIGFGLDALLARVKGSGQRWPALALWSAAVVAVLPLTPLPLPSADASATPVGWQAVFAALRLPAGAPVLTVPVPAGADLMTAPMRWQADTGSPASLVGGYFQGPDRGGHAALDGTGLRPTAVYLDRLWLGDPPRPVPARAQVEDDLRYWRPAAVVAATSADSPLGRYLTGLFGPPSVRSGQVIAWRLVASASGVAVPGRAR